MNKQAEREKFDAAYSKHLMANGNRINKEHAWTWWKARAELDSGGVLDDDFDACKRGGTGPGFLSIPTEAALRAPVQHDRNEIKQLHRKNE